MTAAVVTNWWGVVGLAFAMFAWLPLLAVLAWSERKQR